MGMLKRVKRLIHANLNALIEKAEDPEKTLKQCIRDMEESLRETRGRVAEVVAAQRMLLKKKEAAEAEVEKWERRSILAVQKNEEALAKEAIKKRRSEELTVDRLAAEADHQAQNVEVLKTTLAALEAKLEEAKQKRDILIARKRQAEVKKNMLDHLEDVASVTSNVDTSAFQAFERIEERILTLEAETEGRLEAESGPAGEKPPTPKTNEQRFQEMENADYIAAELERLRKKAREA